MKKPKVNDALIRARSSSRDIIALSQYKVEHPGEGWKEFVHYCKDRDFQIVVVLSARP